MNRLWECVGQQLISQTVQADIMCEEQTSKSELYLTSSGQLWFDSETAAVPANLVQMHINDRE